MNITGANIAEIIHIGRIKKSYSQEDLANMLKVHKQSISRWERGESVPDAYMLIELGKKLDIGKYLFSQDADVTQKIENLQNKIAQLEQKLNVMQDSLERR